MKSLAAELRELRRLKDEAEALGRDKKSADAAFKQQQARALERMEIEEAYSQGVPATADCPSYLYSKVEKVKGQVEDRREYVRWCLENDEAIIEFLTWLDTEVIGTTYVPTSDEVERRFFDAITGTSQVKYKEDGNVMNQQARSHVDDGAPLPPGLTFRPDPYISMTKS